jgi:TP901 family phage tail tape measure protein
MPTIRFTFKSTGGSAVKKEIEEIARLLQQINTSQTGGVEEQFDRLGGAARRVKSEVDEAERAIRDIAAGTQILQQALGAATSAISNGVRDFAAFDDAIRQAGVTSQASAADLAVLRAEAERLGQVSSKTPEEVARTSIELTRAGFSATEAADALEGVVRASEATGTSLTTVGDVVAKTIRQFGLAASDSSQVADVLVQAANSANVSVTTLGESLKFAGVAGAGANQDLETVVASLAALGDVGLQGGIGGRNLTSAFNSLQQVSAAAANEIEGLKTASDSAIAAFETLAVQFRDSNGEIRDLFEILPELRAGLEGLSVDEQDAVVQAIFGTQGSRAVFALLKKTDEELINFRGSLEDATGVAVASGEALNEGLGGSLRLLDSAISAASLAFISKLAPAIQFVVDGLTSLVNSFNELPAPLQTILVGAATLTGAYAALVVAINLQLAAQTKLLAVQLKAAFVNANDAILKGKQVVTTLALAAAKNVLTAATAKATVALTTATGTALAFAAVGAAVALVAARFNAVEGAVRRTEEGLQEYRDATEELLKLNEELATTEEERLDATEARVAANLEAIESEIGLINKFIDAIAFAIEAVTKFASFGLINLDIPDSTEISINAEIRGLEVARAQVDEFITEIENTPSAELEALDPAQIEAQVKRLEALRKELERQRPTSVAAANAQRIYLQSLDATRDRLQSFLPASEAAA